MLSQSDVVVVGVKEMIRDGRLRPGSRLPIEKDLAAALGVSRGSLREGVRALAVMGVLETRQGDGTYVTDLGPTLLLAPLATVVELQPPGAGADLQSVRRVLEMEAAFRAATRISTAQLESAAEILAGVERPASRGNTARHEELLEADLKFHRIIAQASGNPVLESLISAMGSRTARDRLWRALADKGAQTRTNHEHTAILEALYRRDADGARMLMAAHLHGVEAFLLDHDSDATP